MGPPVGSRAAAAAWLRGSGTGTFVGAAGALPAALRARQHAGLRADDAGADVPFVAPADGAQRAQAADRHDAEVAAAPQAGDLVAGRPCKRRVPARDPGFDREARAESPAP